jgi:hypothetical protein
VWYAGASILKEPTACIFKVEHSSALMTDTAGAAKILVIIYQAPQNHVRQFLMFS